MAPMKDYQAVFAGVESTLLSVGSRNIPEVLLRARLDEYKTFEGKILSDADYHWKLVCVVFYSGFRAATVNARLGAIQKHLASFDTISRYGADDVNRILEDPEMIRNSRKVEACVQNARTFEGILAGYGSFRAYVDSFSPQESFENLMLLKEELHYRFRGLGEITTYHMLADIGLPVLKPDRVICRIFRRLGLIESDEQLLKTVIQGRKFAQSTGHPIRYIDIVFVAYGRVQSMEFGLDSGICLEQDPRCSICGVREHCVHYAQSYKAGADCLAMDESPHR